MLSTLLTHYTTTLLAKGLEGPALGQEDEHEVTDYKLFLDNGQEGQSCFPDSSILHRNEGLWHSWSFHF